MRTNWVEYPEKRKDLKKTLKELPEGIDYTTWIGKLVSKRNCSGEGSQPKPFKSGSKVNTVAGIIEHPQQNCPAFTFFEDDSYVACHSCFLIDPREELRWVEDWEFCECGHPLKQEWSGVKCSRCGFTFCY
jgi:hypothetical protein